MKKDKNSCKKNHETNIGKIIYGFLLFMPLLAIGVSCLYAIFNKNAYQSYSADQTLNYTLETTNNIYEDSLYFFKTDNNLNIQLTQNYVKVKNINPILGNLTIPNNPYRFRIYYNGNNTSYSLQIDGDTTTYNILGNTTNIGVVEFNFIAEEDTSNPYSSNLLHYVFSEQQTLDNVFYYCINKVEESNLFNWAKNSIVYNTLETTCNQLSITNTFIPMLLAYWLIISVIYFLYDIALLLIWSAHDKIHELRDSL